MKAKYRPRKNKNISRMPEEVYLYTENGFCYIETNCNVMGIELGFSGKAEITPELPEGWILQGNNKKIIMFTMQNSPIKSCKLFSYNGYIKILSAVVSNDKGERITEIIQENTFTWGTLSFDMSIDASDWKSHKDNKRFGKVKSTTYNLPDYNLPKVEKEKIKKRRRTTRTYTMLDGSTGGY